MTRNGKDWTYRYPALVQEFEKFPVTDAVFDGELVSIDRHGRSDFSRLQNYVAKDSSLRFVLFDILFLADQDLRNESLETRRMVLEKIHAQIPKHKFISLSEKLPYSDRMLEQACKKRWEGIMAKQAKSTYHGQRDRSWVKIKCSNRKEFVVIGMTKPRGSRASFGALLLAEETPEGLVYRGRVGTGFNDAQLKKLYQKFILKKQKTSPLVENLETKDIMLWLTPYFYAEIDYSEKTSQGLLRHPVFYGLREDKEYRVKKNSRQKDSLPFTNPDKILFPDMHLSKTDLWEYYLAVMPYFMHSNVGAPLTLVRCPQGSQKACFFQKHFQDQTSHPQTLKIKEKDHAQGIYSYILSPLDLKALVQLGVLEFHLWNCRISNVENPLYIVFDLDPGEGVSFKKVVAAAFVVKKKLESYGKTSYVRTSGGKGLHVLTSVVGLSWDEAYELSRAIAQEIENDDPSNFVSTMAKAKRKGKIFIDYLRNSRGATSIANYSTRARAGATVATPITWAEAARLKDPKKFNVKTLPARLKKQKSDPWQEFWQEISD